MENVVAFLLQIKVVEIFFSLAQTFVWFIMNHLKGLFCSAVLITFRLAVKSLISGAFFLPCRNL